MIGNQYSCSSFIQKNIFVKKDNNSNKEGERIVFNYKFFELKTFYQPKNNTLVNPKK